MLDIKMVQEEIKRLENTNITNYSICEKLATLYIIKDHFHSTKESVSTSAPTITPPSVSTPTK